MLGMAFRGNAGRMANPRVNRRRSVKCFARSLSSLVSRPHLKIRHLHHGTCWRPLRLVSDLRAKKKVWKCSYMGNGPLDISTGHSNGCTPSPLKGTKLFTPIDDSFGAFNEYLMALINSKSTTKWGGMGSSAYYGPGRENIGSCCKLHLDWGLYVPPTKPTTAGDPMVLITNSDGTGPYEIRGTNDCTNYAWCKKWQTQFSGFLGAVLSFEAAQATIAMAAAGACGSWSRCT